MWRKPDYPAAPGFMEEDAMRDIVIVNRSALINSADLAAAVEALTAQVERDFGPLWGISANLMTWTGDPEPNYEPIYLVDSLSVADALGYHTEQMDRPCGFVDVRATVAAGDAWTATLSHELLEQLADPLCNLSVEGLWRGARALLAYEVADPVENDEYEIDGLRMSNFVLPAWFSGEKPAGVKFDFLGRLNDPYALSPGGYVSYATRLGHWQQAFGRRVPGHQMTATPHSRRWRRQVRGLSPVP